MLSVSLRVVMYFHAPFAFVLVSFIIVNLMRIKKELKEFLSALKNVN